MSVDPAAGLNSFGKAKLSSESQTLANNILLVLFGQPGAYPSIPSLGMYIQGIIIQAYDDIDEHALKSELVNQCGHFAHVVHDGEFDVRKVTTKSKDGNTIPTILFIIPTQVQSVGSQFAVGVFVERGSVKYNFKWLD